MTTKQLHMASPSISYWLLACSICTYLQCWMLILTFSYFLQ